MTDLTHASATEQATRVADKSVSATELCQAYLNRIKAHDEAVGAYLLVDEEGARAQAKAVDQAVERGETLGPLAGVPVALKDLLVTENLVTTAGSKILQGWVPPYDGTVVSKLRSAGAVILGKLNMDEFAMGSSNEHAAYHPCSNPWDLSRVPGGSSGGSAAAVAADLCPISLGTDTGGSIRQPAAFCGLLGIKPTYGRVSRYGVIAYASSLDQIGPLARYADDAALMLEVISGKDARDATSLDEPVPRFRDAVTKGISGLRIGIADEMCGDDVAPEVASAFEAGIATLREAGAVVTRISLPHTRYALAAYYLVATAEASSNLARYDGVRFGPRHGDDQDLATMYEATRGAGFGPEVKRRIMLGTFALRSGYYDEYYKKAQQVRTLISNDFQAAFANVDLIASPTTPTTAFGKGEKTSPMDMYRADIFTLSCNLAGLPGMSMCCGFDSNTMPVGMQLLAAPLHENSLLRCAGQFQKDTDWHQRRPSLGVKDL